MAARSITPWGIALLAVVLVSLAFAAPRQAAADSHVPAGLVAAMDAYITGQAEESAGACEDTDIETDIGKWCWALVSMTEDHAVAAFGPTFSEFTVEVTFERVGEQWQVAAEEGIPGPDAPETGSGLVSDAGRNAAHAALAAGVVLLLVGGAGLLGTRRGVK